MEQNIDTDTLIQMVDVEKIYQHVLAMEGPRYPLDNLEALNTAAAYIHKELESYGLTAEYQDFTVDGLEINFKNVLGYCGDRTESVIVIGSHYDSVQDCPGANDNLSGVAIMLEFARVLSKLDHPPSIILGFFTLEEGHPGFASEIRDLQKKFGVTDSEKRYKSWLLLRLHKVLNVLFRKSLFGGAEGGDFYEQFISQHGSDLSQELRQYFDEWKSIVSKYPASTFFEKMGLIGSNCFVDRLENPAQSVKYMINYDTLGWIYDTPKTQKPLPIPPNFLDTYKVEPEKEIGNFITIIGDLNSGDLLSKFTQKCQKSEVDIPYVGVNLPIPYDVIKAQVPDTLRMDHAPFWRKNIPAITMTDGAEFRSQLYHTPADLSKYMDFDMLAKIVKATLATVLDI